MVFGIGKAGKGKHRNTVVFPDIFVVDDDAFERARSDTAAQLVKTGLQGMATLTMLLAGILNSERRGRTEHLQEDAFQDVCAFGGLSPAR